MTIITLQCTVYTLYIDIDYTPIYNCIVADYQLGNPHSPRPPLYIDLDYGAPTPIYNCIVADYQLWSPHSPPPLH